MRAPVSATAAKGELNLAPVDQCESILFEERTGLFNDSCYQRDRERQSKEEAMYRVQNFREQEQCGRDILQMATCHPNLRFKNGYGNLDACNVDADSRIRIRDPKSTNPRYRQQLSTRVAVAGPDLSRGTSDFDTESELIHFENGRKRRPCSVLTSAQTDPFTPLVPCVKAAQEVKHIVPSWNIVDTRSWVRDADYLKRCKLDRAYLQSHPRKP